MAKTEREKKMADLHQRMNDMLDSIDRATKTMEEKTAAAKDALDAEAATTKQKIEEIKHHTTAAADNLKATGEDFKSHFMSGFNKIQENIDEAKAKIAEGIAAHDQEKLAKYIDNQLDYAASCADLAELAAEEAKLAFLDALKASQDYTELYGEEA